VKLPERARRALLILGSTVVALSAGELAARIHTRLSAGDIRRERAQLTASLPATDGKPIYQAHPYYGYTLRPGVPPADAEGFVDNGRQPVYRRERDEFVIGLFGGSVAMQLAGVPRALLDRLEPAIRERGYRKVQLRNFAIAGWRQPQTFAAVMQNLTDLDLVICLDGFNEINTLSDGNLRKHPANFPADLMYGTLALPSRPEDVLAEAELIRRDQRIARVTGWLDGSWLRSSVMAHLFWRLYAHAYLTRAGALREQLRQSIYEQWIWGTADVSDGAILQKRDRYFAQLADWIRYTQWAADRKGVLFFDFLQPNLHDHGSKPLSAEEQRLAAVKPSQYAHVTDLYARLNLLADGLRREGIAVDSLTKLFQSEGETIYSDDCCHFNPKGIEALGAAIADRILASGRLRNRQPRP